MAYAHQRGVIHRDVKPSNILLDEGGQPHLGDFGIAKVLEVEASTYLTGTGVGVGTPKYMAPEQWRGETSPQADIYALGVVFYELVTGRPPYDADTPAAILLKQATDPLLRPRHFVADLPEAVEGVLFKALAKQPGERYADMASFVAALEGLKQLEGKASEGARREGLAGGLGVLVVMVLGVSVILWWLATAVIGGGTPTPPVESGGRAWRKWRLGRPRRRVWRWGRRGSIPRTA